MNKYINKIKEINKIYNCFSYINDIKEEVDEKLTVSIKGNISQKNLLTSCCSRVLENYISPYDAHVVSCLKNKGYIISGTTVMDEFAMGSFGVNDLFTNCKNFFSNEYNDFIPGGSSSGAAVSVASNCVKYALASSTGGSIRLPAAFNNVIGYKPTFGMVSRHGLVAFANSFDQIGFITKDIYSVKEFFSVISKSDTKDLHTIKDKKNVYELKYSNNKINVLVLSKKIVNIMCETKISEIYSYTVDKINKTNKFNLIFLDIEKDFFQKSLECYFVLSSIEAFSNLLRYSGKVYLNEDKLDTFVNHFLNTHEKFGKNVKERILIGQNFAFDKEIQDKFVSFRNYLINYFSELSCKFHSSVFISPVSSCFPKNINDVNFSQHENYDIFLPLANLIGTAAFSIPSNFERFFGLNVMSIEKFNDFPMLDLLKELFLILNSENDEELSKYNIYK